MPDIKHTFTGGKMNKDVDDRFVPQGEYRHAENIQVRTTDGDGQGEGDSGSVQNIKGTSSAGSINFDGVVNTNYKCVGSVADEKNDKAYFLYRGPNPASLDSSTAPKSPMVYADIVAEKSLKNSLGLVPVLTDIKGFWISNIDLLDTESSGTMYTSIFPDNLAGLSLYNAIRITDTAAQSLRVGMKIFAVGINLEGSPNLKIKKIITGNQNYIILSHPQPLSNTLPDLGSVIFIMPNEERLLNFESNIIITGINVIDDLLFFTDGENEPKKINITKCKSGTDSFSTHTKIKVSDPRDSDEIVDVVDVEFIGVADTDFLNTDLLAENVTVIRKPPKTPPTIHVIKREEINLNVEVDFTPTQSMVDGGGIGSILTLTSNGFSQTNYKVGDTLTMQDANDDNLSISCVFMSYTTSIGEIENSNDIDESEEGSVINVNPVVSVLNPTDTIQVSLVSVNANAGSALDLTDDEWIVSFDIENDSNQKKLFELKFPRFAYRYKYDDGECSSFSPFSEVAFLPGDFDYDVKKGFNLGMTNHIFELAIKDFIPIYTHRGLDVSAVDILVKTTDDANVYILKTIKRAIDPEWELFTTDSDVSILSSPPEFKTGEITLTSEMIHSVIESNQLLRAWDNVPIKAKAQEITSSRLLFANYTQGYDLKNSVSLTQSIISENNASLGSPKKSVKTNRSYKWGLVFGDKYGRETPVLDSSYIIGDATTGFKSFTGDTIVPQTLCGFKNSFLMKQDWNDPSQADTADTPDDWIDYVKYYVKETSSEYYNLVLDRWYYAKEEENIWLSFDSSDRNKVDEETYLYLKSLHGKPDPVIDKDARYKIIDIQNEAPTFIKTEVRILGDIKLGDDLVGAGGGATDTNINSPSTLIESFSFNIPSGSGGSAATIGSFLNDYNLEESKGQLALRIIAKMESGGVVASTHRVHKKIPVNMVHFDDEEGGTNDTYIAWQEALGNSVNYAVHLSDVVAANPGQVIEYYVEFLEEIEINKPEFDGRFFVLIEKDKSIVTNVESQSVPEGSFTYVDTTINFNIAYLASIKQNPATQGPHMDYLFDGDGSISQFGGDITINAGHLGLGCTMKSGDSNLGGGKNKSRPTANFIETIRSQGLDNMLFMDGFRFRCGGLNTVQRDTLISLGYSNITSTSGVDYPSFSQDIINFHKPRALSQGGADTGTYGRMVLSQMIEENDIDGFTGSALSNLATFEEGQLFRFEADTTSSGIYKVINCHKFEGFAIRNHSNIQANNLSNPDAFDVSVEVTTVGANQTLSIGTNLIAGCIPCQDNNGGGFSSMENACFRATRIIDFRRIDTDTNVLTNEGIDYSLFDPRGHVKHDAIGVTDNADRKLKIIKVGLSEIQGSVVVPTTDKAIFETEPKETADLDIYYEATHAIPMRIGEHNYAAYIPHNCGIELGRFLNSRFTQPIISSLSTGAQGGLVVEPRFNPFVSQVGISSSGNPIVALKGYTNSDSTGTPVLLKHGIFPGDEINFIHQDPNSELGAGLKTKSKILKHINALTGQEVTPLTVTAENITEIGQVSVYTNNSINLDAEDNISLVSSTGVQNGMQLVGAYVPQDVVDTLNANIIILPQLIDFINIILLAIEALGGAETNLDIPNNVFITNTTAGNGALLSDTSFMANPEGGVAIPFNLVLVKPTGYYEIDKETWKYPINLNWHNCYTFGNGLESDRVRDDFNAPQLDNGVKASTTITEYGEENRSSGIIYSGIYNSRSSVNKLNEFNMAEKITKDLNPTYGSIQALKTRDTDVITFCEDKVLKVLASKDAVFNADGKPQLTATDKVLGQAIPFVGDYGISKNPESLASDQYRLYFTDKQRGAVLRLSRDGLTPISSVGMKSWFREHLKLSSTLLGTFDTKSGEYNLSFNANNFPNLKTVSFNEATKGWVSFKSFRPTSGVSVSGIYLTSFEASIFEHNAASGNRNIFYTDTEASPSVIDVIFNDMPSTVKSFTSIDYEGSNSKVTLDNKDNNYYNLATRTGWFVESVLTDLEIGSTYDFINKENKWFSKICGENEVFDTSSFAIQGLGFPTAATVVTIETTDGGTIEAESDDGTTVSVDDEGNIIVNESTPVNLTIRNNPEH